MGERTWGTTRTGQDRLGDRAEGGSRLEGRAAGGREAREKGLQAGGAGGGGGGYISRKLGGRKKQKTKNKNTVLKDLWCHLLSDFLRKTMEGKV